MPTKKRITRVFRLYKKLQSEMTHCIECRPGGRFGIACIDPDDRHSVRYRRASWRAEVIEAYITGRKPNYSYHPEMMARGGYIWTQTMEDNFKGWRD